VYVVVLNSKIEKARSFRKEGIIFIEVKDRNSILKTWLGLFFCLKSVIQRKKITNLHPWCTPAGAIAVLLKLFVNKKLKLVVDSYEPHAEAMVENNTWKKNGIKFKILFRLEKLQAKYADHLIFAAHGMQDYVSKKYHVNVKSYFVKPACVDLSLFNVSTVEKKENMITCIYAGKFGGIYLEDEAFEFIKTCYAFWGTKFKFLLLSNVSESYLKEQAERFDFPRTIIENKFVPHSEVAKHMESADFAICPVKPVPSKKYCSPIKTGEYWACGLPVVITKDISDDSEIIESQNIGFVLKELNAKEYLKCVHHIDSLLKEKNRNNLSNKIRSVAESKRHFKIARQVYNAIYAS
jgi:glycosyltransferase involved in cell wall biosynthesis